MSVKVIVYMHITPNGMIATASDHGFSSKRAKADFIKMINKIQVNIVGRRTFDVAVKKGNFPLKGLNILVTKHKVKNKWPNVIVTSASPRKILKIVEQNGYSEAMVAGGKLATSFIKMGLVNDIYLNVEPVVFGRGIRLFSDEEFYKKLKLVDAKRFSKNEVRLHYKVLN
jgi:dihydrofolate reductase